MELLWKIQYLIRKLIKRLYPWIKIEKAPWSQIVTKLREYMPKLHYFNAIWKFSEKNKLIYNTDEASKGNPGMSNFVLCIKDDIGDMIFTRSKRIGVASNTETNIKAIKEALEFI